MELLEQRLGLWESWERGCLNNGGPSNLGLLLIYVVNDILVYNSQSLPKIAISYITKKNKHVRL